MTTTDTCVNGHDIAQCGRTSQGVCKKCRAAYQAEYRARIRRGDHQVTPIAEVAAKHQAARDAKAAAKTERVNPARRGGGSFTTIQGPTDSPAWVKAAAHRNVLAAGGSDLLAKLGLADEVDEA